MIERAELGVDGNCGFALLGEDIQSGEAEFEEILTSEPRWTSEWSRQSRKAINRAHMRLKARLAPRQFSYYLGDSYPQ